MLHVLCMTLSSVLILTVGHDSITKYVCACMYRFNRYCLICIGNIHSMLYMTPSLWIPIFIFTASPITIKWLSKLLMFQRSVCRYHIQYKHAELEVVAVLASV